MQLEFSCSMTRGNSETVSAVTENGECPWAAWGCSGVVLLEWFFSFFQDRISLCSPCCPGTHSVDQAGLELRNPPASASKVLGLKVCATTCPAPNAF